MAKRKNMKSKPQTILLEIPFDSDWPRRLEKVSEQTGLSPISLLQKWILQEETLIGLMRQSGEPSAEEAEISQDEVSQISPAAEVENDEGVTMTASLNSDDPDYRKTLHDRAAALKSEGMALSRIAKTFNDEQVPTVSGSGKWYSSSVSNLLK